MFKRLAGICAAVILVFPGTVVAHPFSGLYVFGDSLSDTGNAQAFVDAVLGNGAFAAGVPPYPPYPLGRITNALNYVDTLSQQLNLGVPVPSALGGTNFAVADARTASNPTFPGTGILEQVAGYRAVAATADPDALYVVFGGANDVRDALLLGGGLPAVQSAATNMGLAIQGLIDEGARHVLVPNIPNLGRTPEALALGLDPLTGAARTGSSAFNGFLDAALDLLRSNPLNSSAHLYELDVFALVEDGIANAAALGFSNTTDACVLQGAACDPSQFIFYDTIHPTSRVHELLGLAAFDAVVPEPGMHMILLIGAVMFGVARRRVRGQ